MIFTRIHGSQALLSSLLHSASRAPDSVVTSLFSSTAEGKSGDVESVSKLTPLPSVSDFFGQVISQVDARSKGKEKHMELNGGNFVKQLLAVSRPYTEAACRLLDRYH